jgi:hypothetical protein
MQEIGTAVVAGLFTLAGAFIALAYQYYRDRMQRVHQERDAKIARRMKIISDLVAYRFVLTDGRESSRGIFGFNSALNRIPIEFIDSVDVLDKYRRFGNSFNAERYHSLIISMIKSTRELPVHIDVQLLETVPSVEKNPPDVNLGIRMVHEWPQGVRQEPVE